MSQHLHCVVLINQRYVKAVKVAVIDVGLRASASCLEGAVYLVHGRRAREEV